MRYALIDEVRREAQPKQHGLCPGCRGTVIAKCGKHVVWHWAHTSPHCDTWWETETEWHRSWKNRFPVEWQEVPLIDAGTQELHIADVRTPAGLVLEFQHSTIDFNEVEARQRFYQKMIWVVDGCKNDFDRFNFSNGRSRTNQHGIVEFRWFSRSKLFDRWHITTPVFIDFGREHGFWRVLRYDPMTKIGRAGLVDPAEFVEFASSGATDFSAVGGPASA